MGGQVKGELDVVEKALKEVSVTLKPSSTAVFLYPNGLVKSFVGF